MGNQAIDLSLDIEVEQPYHVVSCVIDEGLSELSHAHLEIASTENLDLTRVLTDSAKIHLHRDGVPVRQWTLKVGKIGFQRAQADSLRYSVDLYAHPWLLRFTENTRKFRKMSAKDIISQVLGECGVPHRWELSRDPPRRNYCVQYHETNLAFVSRLLEFEGIYYTFDEDGVMVLGDRSSAAPEVAGNSFFELIESETAMSHAAGGIYEFYRGSAAASGKATVNDFDWKKPDKKLIRSAAAGDRDSEFEIYDYPSGYRHIPDGELLAKIRLEALRVPARYVGGRGAVHGFAPCRVFSFGGRAGLPFAGEYLLVHVEHEYHNPAYEKVGGESEGRIYDNEFRAIDRDVPFRPPVVTPRPTIAGYHTVMVRGPLGEEIHTDEWARFRAQFHWDREAVGTDADSRWLRMLQESASSLFLARIGWEVNVAYIDGDPDRPLGLARDINGVMIPAYGQPANMTRMTIKTPTSPASGGYNELRLEDSAGQMHFDIHAERDLSNIVHNDRSETIGNNETREVFGVLQEAVDHDQTVSIGADSTTEVGASHTLEVVKNRSDSVGGSETVKTGGSDNVTVTGNDTESVGAVRVSIVGSVSPPDVGAMAKSAAMSMAPAGGSLEGAAKTVGSGALAGAKSGGLAGAASGAKASLQGMVPSAPTASGLASAATGGLSEGVTLGKLTDMFCNGNIGRSGTQAMTRMVGGAYVAAALGNISWSANYVLAEMIGGVKLTVAADGSVSQSVTGPLATLVGGVIMRTADGDVSYSSPISTVNVGRMAALSSDEKLILESDSTIQLEAQSKLSFTAGDLVVQLEPAKVTVAGDVKLSSGSSITVTGSPDNVTS